MGNGQKAKRQKAYQQDSETARQQDILAVSLQAC